MDYDFPKSVSQGSDGAQDAENSRIAKIADELRRLCQLHEAQSGTGQADVTPNEREQRMAEQMAKEKGKKDNQLRLKCGLTYIFLVKKFG
jgi:hypothetical protein